MARGPIKHMKRLNAPKHWMLGKLGGIWAPRPSTGPHKLRECLPLSLILRNRLKFSLTRRETMMIVMRRHVLVDGKARCDLNFPAGFNDVISIPKAGMNFRLVYDAKGRFVLHKINPEEAKYKLCRVQKADMRKKSSIGANPHLTGRAQVIPAITTHDGRTIRFADPNAKVDDTVKVEIASGKIVGILKFAMGQTVMITRGNNIGRVGTITHIEKHPGSFTIVHVKDKRGVEFSTRKANVFIIGDGEKTAISIPRGKGIVYSVLEERERKANKNKD